LDSLDIGSLEIEIKKIGHSAFFPSAGCHSDTMKKGFEYKEIRQILT